MKLKYLKNVVSLEINRDKCTGCKTCMEVCPHHVLDIRNGKVEMIHRDSCMECGACSKNCPFGAIEVNPGVGCAVAIIKGFLTGTEPTCDCGGGEESNCC